VSKQDEARSAAFDDYLRVAPGNKFPSRVSFDAGYEAGLSRSVEIARDPAQWADDWVDGEAIALAIEAERDGEN
jgi:hypothetical protein